MIRPRLFAAALAAAFLAGEAAAHMPGILRAGTPFVVEEAGVSYALYGVFERGDERFTVTISFSEDFALPFEIFVPHRDELRDHRPAYAIVGAGLPVPGPDELAALPAPLPPGRGAFVELDRVEPRPAFYEFFTRRFFWSSGPVALVLPRGDYEIWIWSPSRTTGKFGLGFGVEERFQMSKAFEGFSTYEW